jgi:ribonuclease P protein component
MLPKKNRADKKAVEKVFKDGRFINFSFLTFKFILNENSAPPRISFIAPKNVAKLAVKRNLLRRLGYNVLKNYINKFPPGLVAVFIFKKYQDDISILENEIKNTISKIN